MNDDVRDERLLADRLHDLAPARAPDRLRMNVKAATSEVRPRDRWLALIKESPMRTNSRTVVGSPTARAVAVMVATLLATLLLISAGLAGSRLLAAGGPIVVDQAGGGHYRTITEALAAAEDGDEIVVRPGSYNEAIVVERDVTLHGDGLADEVVIELDDAELVTLRETSATIADLTLGGGDLVQGMVIEGGAPTIRGVVFDHTGRPFDGEACMGERAICGGRSLIVWASDAEVVESVFRGGGEITIDGGGDVTFERNLVEDGPQFFIPFAGDASVIRENTIRNTIDRAVGLFGPGALTFEENTIEGAGGDAITIGFENATGHDHVIRDNRISGSGAGLRIGIGSGAQVSGNELEGNEIGIEVNSDLATLSGNTLSDNAIGIVVTGSPTLEDNTVEGGDVGIRVAGPNSAPSLSGNTICDNVQDVVLAGRASAPSDDGSNSICGEPVTG